MEAVVITITPFLMVLGIVWIIALNATRRRNTVHETIRAAMQSGQQLTPEVIRELGAANAPESRWNNTAAAYILLAVAAATVCLGITVAIVDDNPDDFILLTSVAIFPLFIGIALLALDARKRRQQHTQ